MAGVPNWGSGSVAERLDRLEALEQIRLLASRYALCVDTKNLDDLVQLFVEDVRVGANETGRAAFRKWFAATLSGFRVSIHQVMNHIIDIDDPDHAHGVVYCRDEIDKGDGKWNIGTIQYWDTYERRGGRWYFKRRKVLRWYMVDALTRPAHGLDVHRGQSNVPQAQLPEAWPTWERFWKEDAIK